MFRFPQVNKVLVEQTPIFSQGRDVTDLAVHTLRPNATLRVFGTHWWTGEPYDCGSKVDGIIETLHKNTEIYPLFNKTNWGVGSTVW